MNIIILHGDHVTKARERLLKFLSSATSRNWEIKHINLENKELSFSEQISGLSLFAKNSLFVLEDLGKVTKKDFNWLKKNSQDIEATLIIFHDGFISKKLLDDLPKFSKIEEFKLPRIIFTFLDAIYPGNSKKALTLLHELTKKEPVEFVFALLAKHLRDVYWAKVDAKTLPYPAWRVGKLSKLANSFSLQSLKYLINKLAVADIDAKTSKTDLLDSLDLILGTKLE